MNDAIVLIHGSANGSYGWGGVRSALSAGSEVFAPDMLGYGKEPGPSEIWSIAEEVEHLERRIDQQGIDTMHLVTHSLGTLFGLHLRRKLGARVKRMTLVDPLLYRALHDQGEDAAYAEMEEVYQRFMGAFPDHAAVARVFVDHWNGSGAWDSLGERASRMIASLAPRLRLEVTAARSDATPLAHLVESPPPTLILAGEKTPLAPRATARLLGRALGAQTRVVAGAGHMVPLTHPKEVARAIESVIS